MRAESVMATTYFLGTTVSARLLRPYPSKGLILIFRAGLRHQDDLAEQAAGFDTPVRFRGAGQR
ncbi:hypothetical protein L3i22_038300 [Actinoplanes sp. L3-i22]|nr:hypothetical protein L3i22_038300 [Actinoplanes sp. L3-i22]